MKDYTNKKINKLELNNEYYKELLNNKKDTEDGVVDLDYFRYKDNEKEKINISLMSDEEKLFLLLLSRIKGRISDKYLPNSFSDLSENTIKKMAFIDRYFQMNVISHEMALQMMADLLEGETWGNRFKEYRNDLLIRKLKDLYNLLWIKKQDLLFALSDGKINREVFSKLNSQLNKLAKNSINDIIKLITFLDNPEQEEEIHKGR